MALENSAHAAPRISTVCLPLYHCPPGQGHGTSRHATVHHPLLVGVRRCMQDVTLRTTQFAALTAHVQVRAINVISIIFAVWVKLYSRLRPLTAALHLVRSRSYGGFAEKRSTLFFSLACAYNSLKHQSVAATSNQPINQGCQINNQHEPERRLIFVCR